VTIETLQTIADWASCKDEQPGWSDNFVEDYMGAKSDIEQLIQEVNKLTNNGAATDIKLISLGISNSQSVDSASDTAMDFNIEYLKDSEFNHDNSTNPSRVTVNQDGRYKISGYISINGTTGSYRYNARCAVRINGTTTSQYIDSSYIRATSGHNENCINVFDVIDLSSGDYIEVMVARINSTSGNATTTPNRVKVIIEKVA